MSSEFDKDLKKDFVNLVEAVNRVRELHFVQRYANSEVCYSCNTRQGVAVEYPCPTINALDGEQ